MYDADISIGIRYMHVNSLSCVRVKVGSAFWNSQWYNTGVCHVPLAFQCVHG